MTAHSLMVQGTGVERRQVVACRWPLLCPGETRTIGEAVQAENMSNNAAITTEGGEIGVRRRYRRLRPALSRRCT